MTAPASTGQYGNEPAAIKVPATIKIEVPGNNRLRNANDSPKDVMNMTGNAQTEWAEMKASVG